MTTWRRLLTTTLLVSCGFAAFLLAAPRAEAGTPRLQLRVDNAALQLQELRVQLAEARTGLRAALAAEAQDQIQQCRDQIGRLKPRVARLTQQIRRWRWILDHPMQPSATGSWMPVIRAAAERHHLSAAALYRMMRLESGGRARAVGGGLFLGLFQYYPPTWKAAWNPFRSYSIFNGGAQIWATAYAIHRGWARHMWPNTYRMAFGV